MWLCVYQRLRLGDALVLGCANLAIPACWRRSSAPHRRCAAVALGHRDARQAARDSLAPPAHTTWRCSKVRPPSGNGKRRNRAHTGARASGLGANSTAGTQRGLVPLAATRTAGPSQQLGQAGRRRFQQLPVCAAEWRWQSAAALHLRCQPRARRPACSERVAQSCPSPHRPLWPRPESTTAS